MIIKPFFCDFIVNTYTITINHLRENYNYHTLPIRFHMNIYEHTVNCHTYWIVVLFYPSITHIKYIGTSDHHPFIDEFSTFPTIQRAWGTPMTMETLYPSYFSGFTLVISGFTLFISGFTLVISRLTLVISVVVYLTNIPLSQNQGELPHFVSGMSHWISISFFQNIETRTKQNIP